MSAVDMTAIRIAMRLWIAATTVVATAMTATMAAASRTIERRKSNQTQRHHANF